MASVTIKNIPENLHRRLKREAKLSGRSMQQEILLRLHASPAPARRDVAAQIAEIRALHDRQRAEGVRLDPEDVLRWTGEHRI